MKKLSIQTRSEKPRMYSENNKDKNSKNSNSFLIFLGGFTTSYGEVVGVPYNSQGAYS